ncbi:MAG: MDR family NADPH-dependent oxidoreductase [Chthoniobacterales bacterium]
MSRRLKAAIYETHGNPPDVLRIIEQEWPTPAADEVVVQMRAAPLNPADINSIEGKYPVKPPLPATPGMEGAGVVVELGTNVRNFAPGALVILPHNLGTWREACAVRADRLVAVPAGIDPAQAAMLKVNPITAWRMLHDFVKLERGDWLIQNVANSGAGRAVIAIAKALGWKTVNVVRRAELIDELRREGADVVVVDGENLRDEVKAQTGGAPIRLALNAVGGDNAIRCAGCLAPEAVMVTYGAMSLQPLQIPNGMLIFKNLWFTGFWITKWYDSSTSAERSEMWSALFDLAKRGVLHSPIEARYSLGQAHDALQHAMRNKRSGKVIFEFA